MAPAQNQSSLLSFIEGERGSDSARQEQGGREELSIIKDKGGGGMRMMTDEGDRQEPEECENNEGDRQEPEEERESDEGDRQELEEEERESEEMENDERE